MPNVDPSPAGQFEYCKLPERSRQPVAEFKRLGFALTDETKALVDRFAGVAPRKPDVDGDVEVFDRVAFTHRFLRTPGDNDSVGWHYVEAGEGEPIIFLHGIPDSWFQWHHTMAALSSTHRCIGIDLKGYGQSEKEPGDYRHAGAAAQMVTLLDYIGIDRFNLVTHDRGTVQGDHIVADHPDRVLRYGRGDQHLYHFNPALAPQQDMFQSAPWTGIMDDPRPFVIWLHNRQVPSPIPETEMARVIQEFSYPGVTRAVPRYFNSSTSRQEWIERRTRLLDAWTCPVMIMQSFSSTTQPRELYEDAREHIPNASAVEVGLLPGGHYWPQDVPEEATATVRSLLAMEPR